jgi:hypothetical protein
MDCCESAAPGTGTAFERMRDAIKLQSDRAMNSVLPAISVISQDQCSNLSRSQKRFNNLIKKIDAERKRLAAWNAMIPQYNQKHASEYAPLAQRFDELRAELVRLFDKAISEKTFTKSEKTKLKSIICGIVPELIADNDDDADEDLKRIYNKHSGGDFDAELQQEKDAMKEMMEHLLGIDLGESFDPGSPEEMMAHVGEKVRRKMEDLKQEQLDHQERNAKRKKSAKVLAKEAKQKAEAQDISQSIRDVYRKLVSALHPDREQDVAERDRKTALMQRVNTAYKNKDLLKLLELQLEVEQIDQSAINTISEDKLKHYNKILAEQSKDLEMEFLAVRDYFGIRFNIPPHVSMTPENAIRKLESDIGRLKKDIGDLRRDLKCFESAKRMKEYLKHYRVPRQNDFGGESFWTSEAFF